MINRDKFGRNIDYLRLSVTDHCNFNCGYCYSDNKPLPRKDVLSLEEINKVASIAKGIGFKYLKLTGGEPLYRKNIIWLVKRLSRIGFDDFSITTNGFYLKEYSKELKKAGLKRVTVSLDTLNKETFSYLTGKNEVVKVIEGIAEAIKQFNEIKMNVVLIKGINDNEIDDFISFVNNKPIHIRFIELISNNGYRPVSNEYIKEKISKKIKLGEKVKNGCGPSQTYEIINSQNTVGFISLKSQKFCNTCNRLRIRANGEIKPCLYSNKKINAKNIIKNCNDEEIKRIIREAIAAKPKSYETNNTKMRKNGG